MFRTVKMQQIEDNSFLSSPITGKEIECGQSFVFAGMQGWRKSNEDFHKHLVPIDSYLWKFWSYFAIFDGHNGSDTAKNATNLLETYLVDALNKTRLNSFDHSLNTFRVNLNELSHFIKSSFRTLDKYLAGLINDQSGSVCITCLIGPEYIYLINLGDSRALIISNSGHILAQTKGSSGLVSSFLLYEKNFLIEDHKPDVEEEVKRINRFGGRITRLDHDVARVQDRLAVTRTLGDYSLDKRLIPASPDIIQYPKYSSAAYVILASDGVWDVMTSEQVASFVLDKITRNFSLENTASQLLDQCLQLDSTDNLSVYIIKVE